MTRPRGITALSIALGWLAVAGIGNAIVWNLGVVQSLLVQLPKSRNILPMLNGPLFSIVASGYALSAAVACIGLWRMRPWAPKAYAAWCGAVLLLGAFMAFSGPVSAVGVVLLYAVGLTAFVSIGYHYVGKKTKARTHAQPRST
jgi:hypothetical protein